MTETEEILQEQYPYGLVGARVDYSWSPEIHNRLGNGEYGLYSVAPGELEAFLSDPRLKGVNITIPFKQEAVGLCARLTPEARACGSVNTMRRQKDGSWIGHNTDAIGMMWQMEQADISLSGKAVVICGSGGAARTARAVALMCGAADVVMLSRSSGDYENTELWQKGQILINATPLGTYPDSDKMPLDPQLLPDCQGVLDLVYHPRRTALIQKAEALHIPCMDGLPMLIAQASAACSFFTGEPERPERLPEILNVMRRRKGNIVLIGMPGCGKSVVGRALSRLAHRRVVDIDTVIRQETGMTIPEIFEQQGEAGFRAMERQQIARWGAETGLVLVTGGGAVLDERNYAPLHQNGRIYQIVRDTAELSLRDRPLSQGADLDAMEAARRPFYRRFRDAVYPSVGRPEHIAGEIWRDYLTHICE